MISNSINLNYWGNTTLYSKIAIFAPIYDWQTPEDGSEEQKQAKTTFFQLQSLIFFQNQQRPPFFYTLMES